MTALLIIIAAIVLLFAGYVGYGSWLAKQWGIDATKKTPAFTKADGVDYVAAKPAVLMGHHFSSIAGAGPINGPIQASVFGWVPWAAFSLAACRISVRFLRLHGTKVNPSARLSAILWERPPKSSLSFSRSLF